MLSMTRATKVGPSFVGGEDGPERLVCPGGEGSSRSEWSQSLTSAASQIEQTTYFANSCRFSFRTIGSRRFVDATQSRTRPADLRETLYGGQFILAGASPACRRFARDALEDGRKMRLRAEADVQRDFGQGRFSVRQQQLRAFDALMLEIFAWAISRRSAELRRKVHAGQTCGLGEVGQTDAATEMCLNVILDAPEPPFRQGIDFGSRKFEPDEKHRKRLTDATRKLFVGRIAVLGQRLCELLGERIAQQDEVIQAHRPEELRRRLL